MSAALVMPGAVLRRKYAGGTMTGGPAHAVEHITWDRLNPDHTRAVTIEGVAAYLESKGYAPTVMIDPFTGDAIQFYYPNEGASALRNEAGGVETNNDGSVCIQCEWLFTPGMVWEGKTYGTLRDTPMLGLDVYLAWCESWGVPSVWPMGEPDFHSQRDAHTWVTRAGHFGHSQVPENDHTDPGPMRLTTLGTIMSKLDKDDRAFLTNLIGDAKEEIIAKVGDVGEVVMGRRNPDGSDKDHTHYGLNDAGDDLAELRKAAGIPRKK